MVVSACLRSFHLYLAWWWSALRPGQDQSSPHTLRRFLFLFVFFPLFLLVQIVHWFCWSLDAILYPSAGRKVVKQPIFITGIPRSGTTFVHRSLARASGLTTFTTWETILAPCICQKRLLRFLARMDARIGSLLRKSVDRLICWASGDFSQIHRVDLAAPEEDYLALLPFGGCFLLALAFPGVRDLRDLARFDQLPEKRRAEMLDIYHQCLQKKCYTAPANTRLLSKNAAFGSWVPDLAKRYPDATFLLCVRNPLEALSSQISSLEGARQLFGTDPHGGKTATLMRGVFCHNYGQIARLAESPTLQKRCCVLDQNDLKIHPKAMLTAAADFVGLWANARLMAHIDQLESAGQSTHRHEASSIPGDCQEFQRETAVSYAAILDLDCRIHPTYAMTASPPRPPDPSSLARPSLEATKGTDLRVAFFSDSLPERNGTGAYYHDLIEQLAPRVGAVEIFQPKPRKGRPLLSLPMPGDPSQRLVAPNIWRIRRGFRQLQPTVVVSITPGPFGLLGLYHAKQHGACFISAFHTDFEKLAKLYWRPFNRAIANGFLRNANRLLCRQSSAVLINNSELHADVKALGASSVEVMGTPIQRAFLERPLKAPPGKVSQICFAGRLAAEKNVDQIIEAARRFPDIHFVIGGDGPLRKQLEGSATNAPNIEFPGWLSRNALLDLIDESSLLLLPSKLETFGSVALEAMARGRPALVSANAGIHDWPLLREGLFKLESTQTLGDALSEILLLPPEAWQTKAAAARQAAEELNKATIDQWVDVLHRFDKSK